MEYGANAPTITGLTAMCGVCQEPFVIVTIPSYMRVGQGDFDVFICVKCLDIAPSTGGASHYALLNRRRTYPRPTPKPPEPQNRIIKEGRIPAKLVDPNDPERPSLFTNIRRALRVLRGAKE